VWVGREYYQVRACITSRPTHMLPRCGTDFFICEYLRKSAAHFFLRIR
jgi:hypothetical protein